MDSDHCKEQLVEARLCMPLLCLKKISHNAYVQHLSINTSPPNAEHPPQLYSILHSIRLPRGCLLRGRSFGALILQLGVEFVPALHRGDVVAYTSSIMSASPSTDHVPVEEKDRFVRVTREERRKEWLHTVPVKISERGSETYVAATKHQPCTLEPSNPNLSP